MLLDAKNKMPIVRDTGARSQTRLLLCIKVTETCPVGSFSGSYLAKYNCEILGVHSQYVPKSNVDI